ncbi:unnamed protein product [Caretta caretta]
MCRKWDCGLDRGQRGEADRIQYSLFCKMAADGNMGTRYLKLVRKPKKRILCLTQAPVSILWSVTSQTLHLS